jgi:hypothetical protein
MVSTELHPTHVKWIDNAVEGQRLPQWIQQLDDKAACKWHVLALLYKEQRPMNRGEIIRRLPQFEPGAVVMAIKRAHDHNELSKDDRGTYSLIKFKK